MALGSSKYWSRCTPSVGFGEPHDWSRGAPVVGDGAQNFSSEAPKCWCWAVGTAKPVSLGPRVGLEVNKGWPAVVTISGAPRVDGERE